MWLRESTRQNIISVGNFGETYCDVIDRMIHEYKEKRKESEKQCVIKK